MINRIVEKQSSSFRTLTPLRILQSSETSNIIVNFLQAIPNLLNEYLVPSHAGNSSKSFNSVATTDCITADNPDSSTRIAKAISNITSALSSKSKQRGMSEVKDMCLAIRNILLEIEDLSSPTARLGLLADVLVLWAFTNNFSTNQIYSSVESGLVAVVARDLGSDVTASKLYPKNAQSKRFKSDDQNDSLTTGCLDYIQEGKFMLLS